MTRASHTRVARRAAIKILCAWCCNARMRREQMAASRWSFDGQKRTGDIPLFMIEERPARLMRHAPPYGFKYGVGRKAFVLSELVAMRANATLPSIRRFQSCAVVGSSGTLLHHRFGPEIDAHEAVIRVNGAPLGPRFEHIAGARTTWRVFASPHPASHSQFTEESTYANQTLLVLCNREYVYSCQNVLFAQRKTRVHGINPRFYESVRRQVHKRYKTRQPLTGVVAVAAALRSCASVDVYGMSTLASRRSCFYYWLCGANVTDAAYHGRADDFRSRHDFAKNAQALLRWNASGLIRLH